MNNHLKSVLTLLTMIAVPGAIALFGQAAEAVCGFFAIVTILWISEAMLSKPWTFLSPYLQKAS